MTQTNLSCDHSWCACGYVFCLSGCWTRWCGRGAGYFNNWTEHDNNSCFEPSLSGHLFSSQ